MKICNQCKQPYPDDTLRFCLFDGSALSDSNDSEVTIITDNSEETIVVNNKNKKENIIKSQIKFPLELFRIYCLFGFETDGKTESTLWNNPLSFHDSVKENKTEILKKFNNWKLKKRKFTLDEILDGKWVKIGSHGNSFCVRFHDDETLTEIDIFSLDESESWSGEWKLIDGILRLNIGDYELYIVASVDGLHSGVEHINDNEPAYFKVVHVK